MVRLRICAPLEGLDLPAASIGFAEGKRCNPLVTKPGACRFVDF
jgi:hypothetical protein